MELRSRTRRLPSVLAFGAVAALTLAGCQANPGDAPTVEDPSAASSAAPRSTTRGAVPDELRTVTAGVDTVPADSNPHLIGSQSLATSVIAALTLPSAFTAREGGRSDLNTDLLDAAEVTAGDRDAPTAVRYRISGAAQWSDGTPVTGSDFEYLHDQITTQPGVLDQALYASVKDLSVSAGGRTVDVTFTGPQPDWHDLFADLLPSHIYRAENRPFATMMEGKPAASAGQYAVRGFDAGRGTVQLARNDRFWGDTPARTDSIVLTVVPDDATAAQMLRTGQLQLVATRRGAVTGESLGSVPGVTTRTTGRRTDLTLALNTTSPLLAEASRRAEVLSAVDAGAVARTVSGSPDATAPAPLPAAAESHDRSAEPTGGAAPEPGDAPLRIGAEESDRSAVEGARRVVDQLVSAGIPAQVVTPAAADLYGTYLPRGEVDAVVAWQDEDETLADVRSHFGCDPAVRQVGDPATPLPSSSGRPTTPSTPPSSSTSSDSAVPTTTAPATGEMSEPTAPGRPARDGGGRASNLSGLCDPEIDGLLDAAAADTDPDGATLPATIDRVRELAGGSAVELPLTDDRLVVAVAGVDGPGDGLADWPMGRETGPFLSAGEWTRTPTGGGRQSTQEPEEDDR
ncbi:ABC transporter substrate-binding protein [Corynebacterium nuruki]|uniref:ABC transporter substrate-binding protein n=1 Tax=Corynebacterium nuruki TaxID=1032851 RepID=UPI0039BF9600